MRVNCTKWPRKKNWIGPIDSDSIGDKDCSNENRNQPQPITVKWGINLQCWFAFMICHRACPRRKWKPKKKLRKIPIDQRGSRENSDVLQVNIFVALVQCSNVNRTSEMALPTAYRKLHFAQWNARIPVARTTLTRGYGLNPVAVHMLRLVCVCR